MSDLLKNSIALLQKRFPQAIVVNEERKLLHHTHGNVVKRLWPLMAQDPISGIKQRAIAIEDLGDAVEIKSIATQINQLFQGLDNSVLVTFDNTIKRKRHPIDNSQMTLSPRIILYTNRLTTNYDTIIEQFSQFSLLIEIFCEADVHKSLFISYGGPDEETASNINNVLKSKGITTWFFPDDALPGQKLHRVMHDGVNEHDRVLLLCSENSLKRSGVLNELERVLEREAKEGGSEILVPITIDDFVYSDWAPDRSDLASQIRSRVITKVDVSDFSSADTQKQLNKLITVLTT